MKQNLFLAFIMLFATSIYAQSSSTCSNPTGFSVTRNSDTSATIAVDNPNDTYDVFIAVNGSAGANPNSSFTPPSGLNNDNNNVTQPRTTLRANDTYQVWIRRQCATETSEWVGPVNVPLYVAPVTCAEPTGFNVTRTSPTSATISVDNPNDMYDVFVAVNGSAGANPNSSPTPPSGLNNDNNNVTLPRTTLQPNDVYQVWIRRQCATETSEWVGPVNVPLYVAPETCAEPTGFDVTRTSPTSATISVDNPNDTYDVFVAVNGSAGANPNSSPTPPSGLNNDNNNVTLPRTNLQPNDIYQVWIRRQCATETSEWVGPVEVPLYQVSCPVPTATVTRPTPTSMEVTTNVAKWDMVFNIFPNIPGNPPNPQSRFNDLEGTLNYPSPAISGNPLNANQTYYLWFRQQCTPTETSDWSTMYTLEPTNATPIVASPNPTTGLLRLSGRKVVSAEVINVTGKSEFSTNVIDNEINIAPLAPGQYILKVIDENKNVEMIKVIKK